jgi:RNA polymerase sigma factor (sigma-70 family)
VTSPDRPNGCVPPGRDCRGAHRADPARSPYWRRSGGENLSRFWPRRFSALRAFPAGGIATIKSPISVQRVDASADADVEHSDADLLAAVRAGDDSAYAELWTRHQAAARRMAAQVAPPRDVDDLVSESYYRVLRVVKAGHGPHDAFRPYLFSTMRRFAIDKARCYERRVTLTDQAADLEAEPAPSAADVAALNAEQHAAWRAWASLPEASRAVLWHVVVERQTPAELAPILGTSPNGVTLRARRAKERLRQAFLQQHLAATDDQECRATRRQLGPYIRDALSSRDRATVDEHLEQCERCRAALLEVDDVNNTLRTVIAPVILGGALAAGHYLSSAGSVGHATAASGSGPNSAAPSGADATSSGSATDSHRLWQTRSRTVTLAVAGAAAAIAALVVILGVLHGSPKQSPHAAPNPTAPSSPGARGPITGGSVGASAATGVPHPSGTSAPGSGDVQPPGGAQPPRGAAPRPGGTAQTPAAGLPQGVAAAAAGGTPLSAAGPAGNAAPSAGQQPAATSTAPAGPAPPPANPSPATVREAVTVAIPDPAASVTMLVPTQWTIEAVDAAGIAVTGCTGLHTTTVRCLNLGVGRTLAVQVQGIRTPGAVLHVSTVGLGGGVRDYPL